MNFGDIIVVKYPFTDFSGFKKRPAFVLKEFSEDILLCFIGSRLENRAQHDILIKKTASNGLVEHSLIKTTKILTLHKKLFVSKIGSETPENKKNIKSALIQMIKEF